MDTRELAIITWIIILLICGFLAESTRESILDIFKAINQVILQPVSCILLVYQLLICSILLWLFEVHNLDIWIVKDYIVVVALSIFPFLQDISFFNFWKRILGSIGLNSLISFLWSNHTFTYLIEMFLIGLFIVLSIILVYGERNNQKTLVKIINVSIVVFIIFEIMYNLIINGSEVLSFSYWEGYAIEPIAFIINIPLFIISVPLLQFDILDNFTNRKKTSSKLLVQSILFCIGYMLFYPLKFSKANNQVMYVRQTGPAAIYFVVCVKEKITKWQLFQIKMIYRFGLGPASSYRINTKKVPLLIAYCHENDENNYGELYHLRDIQEDYLNLAYYS